MSGLQTIDNVKIPYPVEGVIRTAQLDDTVTPQDSVQLAVNMNFDRVGAIQTRPGVTQYATSLGGEVKNFGTLRNAIRPDGYSEINLLGETGIFSTAVSPISAVKVSDTRVLICWSGEGEDGFAQLFETSLTTGGLIPIGTALEFDTSIALSIKVSQVDATNFLVVWEGTGGDGFAQVLRVNLGTGAVTAIGTALEFDTTAARGMSISKVDANHFIVFYNNGTDGIATILEVNLSTYAVTEPGSPFTFQSGASGDISSAALGDGVRFINFWSQGGDGKAQVFLVDTGTWGISAIGSPLVLGYNTRYSSAASLGDSEHFINCFAEDGDDGTAQMFNVDPSTYAVTVVGSPFVFQTTTSVVDIATVSMGSGEDFVSFWRSDGDVYTQIFSVDLATFDVTGSGTPILASTGNLNFEALDAINMGPYNVMGFWQNADDEGQGGMFFTIGDIVNQRFLYAGVGEEVKNWDGSSWVTRRSSLAEVSKPRFDQYLNQIWMVNGNSSLGGDPVATSDGGDFNTDLVPAGLPPGDFIHAGLEGRVWIADKSVGIIYYTDIVQFVPPDVYSFTYNADTNFITTLSPQTGQNFTAMFRVPRALLVFTEDHIYRIYGATSVDAYPAYDVGTYSQESIIQTKTGIFFHHSSGFYQFDYGSQPVEISRRIIDFVKAIPRSYYEDITGVYDGFDNVMWYVGSVTVEGVVFSNCALRYTISTQVWTIYDYVNNVVTAMIIYDDGDVLTHLMGTQAGLVGSIDTGPTDFGSSFYYEMIDRWRSFTDMYCETKALDGINVYSENAAGANISYQIQKSGPNAWIPLATVDERNNSLFPSQGTEDFDVLRLRIAGNTKGTQVVIHGIEIPAITVKGYNVN